MFSKMLFCAALAVSVTASSLPAPSSQFETDLYAAIGPVIDWNNKLFGITAEGVPQDDWHDANGKPSGTFERVEEFVNEGVEAWKTAGPKLADLAKQVDSTTANADYLKLLKYVFPASFDTSWFARLSADWSSGLGVSADAAKALGAKYDQAWLNAVLDVETVIPNATRDYEVATSMSWLPDELRNYYYDKMAEHIESVPWEPVVQYCEDQNKFKCNNGLNTYPSGTCYSTADLGVQATYIGIGNDRRGFNWACQIYTDNACAEAVFIPAQPCAYPPPWDVYCQPHSDWNGVFGGAGNPPNNAQNPAGLPIFNVGSFKCS